MQNDTMPNDVGALELLISEHEQVKTMLSRLQAVEDEGERMSCLKEIQRALTIHNATEENIIYPALNKIAGHKLEPLKLYNETAQADMMLFELDVMLKTGDVEDFAEKAERFCDAILEHIDDEEKKAFPHLRDGADPEELQMLSEAVATFRQSLGMQGEGGGTRSTTAERGEIGAPAQNIAG